MWGGHPAWVGALLALLVPVQAWGAAGDPDPSFGVDGKVTTAIGNADNHANAVALQPDGRIIGVGFAFHSATADGFTNDDFAVVRYNSNGDLDPTFNGDGIVSTPIGTFKDIANAVVAPQRSP